ncbi:ATP-grasp domain-containing protein [Actinomadura sp. 6K520]|uniref:ATP-grasp domain-containing protein n=1 Tax=Actinomadura sp. 6K520 TaxID=2530364 RepID=UPI00104F0545|nr:ATP-grasp domain-containing protein [Actinomadura sp. 6K520]TDE28625.1 ATP-grasp domain-containing protein [Actinomadura sp. 6K520]
MATHDRPHLLVIATGWRVYREYLLRSISERFRVHLFHVAEPTWEKEYITGWTVVPSTIDGPAMAEEALRLAGREPVDGVLCWDEARILPTAHVTEALGLPGGGPETILRVRDKGRTRAALDAAGVPQPRSAPVTTLDEALRAAEDIGYPVVLKPRGLAASLGVVRVKDAGELRDRFTFSLSAKAPDPVGLDMPTPLLVEECVTGEEISVDAVVRHGEVTALYVGRKVVGYPPYMEEVGHVVAGDDPLLSDGVLLDALQSAHTALGFRDGWTHTEFILTADGPKLIEVNGRLGGDMIPYLGRLATGIDPGHAAAAVACGLAPDVAPAHARAAGIRFFYPAHDDTTIASVGFDPARLPAEVDQVSPMVLPGTVVSPPPKGIVLGRIAFATAVADTVPECHEALQAAGSALVVETGAPETGASETGEPA